MTLKAFAGFVVALSLVGSNAIRLGPTPEVVKAQSSAVTNLGAVTPIDVPGATNTLALDINAAGDIVGRYGSAGRTHGFLRTFAGVFTTIDFPGASLTVATSINDSGDIVGQYALPTDALPTAPIHRHGFLLKDGEYTSFDPQGSRFTNVLGINERGDIVGRYCSLAACRLPGMGDFHGFALHDGEFTFIDVPDAVETDAFKVNGRGQIAGGFVAAGGGEQVFLLSKGAFTTMALPGGQPVSMDNGGFNERGDIVGTYCDGAAPCLIALTGTHGFLISGGVFTPIDIPGAAATAAVGINARGDVVGSYSDAGGFFHGFLLSEWVYQPSR